MLLDYNKALELASDYLDTVPNLNKFCFEHQLGYQNVINIHRKNKKKPYPKLVSKILTIFGSNVTIQTYFYIENKRT